MKKDKIRDIVSVKKSSSIKWLMVFVTLGLLSSAAALYFILPKAEIILFPRIETAHRDMKIFISSSQTRIDLDTNTIPGNIQESVINLSDRFSATGIKDLSGRAQGIIMVYNEDQPLSLIPSRFESSGGLVFLSQETVKLKGPDTGGPGITAIEVIAEKPGSEYNLLPDNFVLPAFKEIKSPRYTLVYGKSENAMQGGRDDALKIVSESDLEKARKFLLEEATQQFRKGLDGGYSLVEPSLETEELNFASSLEAGEEAEAFNASLEVKLKAMRFREEDLKYLVRENLLSRSGESSIAIEESLRVEMKNSDLDENGRITLEVLANEKIYRNFNTEKIKTDLKGKSQGETEEYLSGISGLFSSQVSFWPLWVNRIPQNTGKINIKVNIDENEKL